MSITNMHVEHWIWLPVQNNVNRNLPSRLPPLTGTLIFYEVTLMAKNIKWFKQMHFCSLMPNKIIRQAFRQIYFFPNKWSLINLFFV